MTPRRLLFALLLALAACSDAPPPPPPAPPPAEVVQPLRPEPPSKPGELRLRCELYGVMHRAVLNDDAGQRWKLVELTPPPRGPLVVEDLHWVFCALPPQADLETPEGRIIGHPDRGLLSELLGRAAAAPPDVEGILGQLHHLLRCESRAQLFTRLAAQEPLGKQRLDLLIACATAPAGEGLLRPDPSGAGPGGDPAEARATALSALTDRLDLDRARADQLARACELVARDPLVREVIERLIASGRASTPAMVEAAMVSLDTPQNRAGVLLLLVKKREAPQDLTELVKAAPRIGNEAGERQLLLELVARGAPARGLVDAVRRGLVAPASRHAVLLALAKREVSIPNLRLVAEAAPDLSQEALEAEVLEALAARPGIAVTILASAERGLVSPIGRRRVLLALAQRGVETVGEAEAVAARVHWIGHEGYEAEVLVALAKGPARPAAIIAASRRGLATPASRGAVFQALAARDLSAGEANQLAAATPGALGTPAAAELLLKLVGRAGDDHIAAAAGQLEDLDERKRVLKAIGRVE